MRRADFLAAGGFPEYSLPWSDRAYFVNEDAEFAFFLVRSTGKPLRWMRDNGVAHGYRSGLAALFRQQIGWTESILISYARFPEMLRARSHYSRSSGALNVLTCALMYLSLGLALIFSNSLIAAGVLPFFGVSAPAALTLNRGQPRVGLLRCFAFQVWVSTAWTLGLVFGTLKGAAAYTLWMARRTTEC